MEAVVLTRDDLGHAAAVVHGWHDEVVCPLRRARRALRPPRKAGAGPHTSEAAALRACVKTAELEAERIEQAMLRTWWRGRAAPSHRAEPHDALAANMRALLVASGADDQNADPGCTLPYLLRAALAERAQGRR